MALWMGAGRSLFGIGGELTGWYLMLIAAPYVLLHLLATFRFSVAERRGRPLKRAALGTIWLSWACAIGFGFTVPDLIDGEFVTIVGKFGGPVAQEMAIALCNPFGIMAFALIIASIAFAIASGMPPRPDEDAILDAAEAAAAQAVEAAQAIEATQAAEVAETAADQAAGSTLADSSTSRE